MRSAGLDLEQRRELNNGFGDSLAKAVELTLTPAVFGFLGHLLDNRLGTNPIFLLLFTLFTFGYVAWKSWGSYERRMQEHEARLHVNARSEPVITREPPGG
jgi:Putative F0F1-ATPase subunit Ca2+/Mg2+ transporter